MEYFNNKILNKYIIYLTECHVATVYNIKLEEIYNKDQTVKDDYKDCYNLTWSYNNQNLNDLKQFTKQINNLECKIKLITFANDNLKEQNIELTKQVEYLKHLYEKNIEN